MSIKDMSPVDQKLAKAKAALVIENPFIASLICGMQLHVDDTINPPTLCTNGKWVKAHPEWITEHDAKEVKWALAHETMHCVFQHFLKSRLGPRNFLKWNIAGDVIINVMLEQDGVGKRPQGVIWDAHPMLSGHTAKELYELGGGTTEGVYALLPEGEGGGGGQDDGAGQRWDTCEPMQGDASQQAEAEAEWNVKIAQAAAAAKMCGKLSAPMERFIDGCLQPKVSWKAQLRDFFTKRARIERSFSRPNRRFMSQGLYLPGMAGHQLEDIVVAVDLSGSVGPDELQEFVTELNAIKEDCIPKTTHVIYFDSKVSHYESFDADEPLMLNPKGGGGTAFSPIFEYVADHDIYPAAAVVLTDLYCSDFGPPPDYPVMWASTHSSEAPWGQVIMLREKAL